MVDVMIMTYNEELSLLKKTIAGCLNLEYPGNRLNIYLCDDGRRDAAKSLCNEFGIHYITRDDNQHAKAGNINNALKQTAGEFILLLDADMVPKPGFLEKTIHYFTNQNVGFVQTPQVFSNPDPFQYNLGFNRSIPNEQDFFMMDVQGGRARFNSVLHVGTNAVFRRTAIEAIGGIPTGTITEDMATGMLIQSKGYLAVFVKEILCTGLSVERFSDMVKQRERWGRGNIQVVKKWNPLTTKGLTLAQRLIYMDGFNYWFFGIQKIIYITMPILYLIFGIVVIEASALDMLFFWLPSFVASTLTFRALIKKRRTITWSHIYEVAMAPYLALALLMEFFFARELSFRVTPKKIKTDRTTISLGIALPHIIFYLLTIMGWAYTIPLLISDSGINESAFAINFMWSLYNFFGIIMGILVCLERPRMRSVERFPVDASIKMTLNGSIDCSIMDLSESGLNVICSNPVQAHLPAVGSIVWFAGDGFEKVKGEVKWNRTIADGTALGIELLEPSKQVYLGIVKYIMERDEGYYLNR
jgi:cellulose synthase (UDP-forming)